MPVYPYKNTKGQTLYYCSISFKNWQGLQDRHVKRGFKLQREAKAYEAEFKAKLSKDCSMTFATLAEQYLAYHENRVAANTYKNREKMVNAHFLPAFAKIPINQIDTAIIVSWQNELLKQNFKQTYLHTLNSNLSMIFNYARKVYGLAVNPVVNAGSIGKKNTDKIIFWTLDNFNKFISTFRTTKYSIKINRFRCCYETVFFTLFYTGLRIGELLALTLADYDREACTITINKSLSRDGVIGPPKTESSNRTVTLPKHLCIMLDEYIKTLYAPKANSSLFEPVNYTKLRNLLEDVIERAKLPRITLHDLRHAHASLLISMDVNILSVSERLGHESVKITLDRYGHLYPNKKQEVANQLDNLLKL